MARWRWTGISYVLAVLLISSAAAVEQEVALDLDFLEFLGEGKSLDGEYHDPLQMQDWLDKKIVDAGQQQEDKDHE